MENLYASPHDRIIFQGRIAIGFHLIFTLKLHKCIFLRKRNGIKDAIWMHCAMGNKFLIFISNRIYSHRLNSVFWDAFQLALILSITSRWLRLNPSKFQIEMFHFLNFKCFDCWVCCRFREIDGAHSIKSRLLIKNEIDFVSGSGEKKADQQKNLCEFFFLLLRHWSETES